MKEIPSYFYRRTNRRREIRDRFVLRPGRLKAEIVCCDAMQVYREIAIANDKPSAKARALVPHHLVDILSVTEDFNVARYSRVSRVMLSRTYRPAAKHL